MLTDLSPLAGITPEYAVLDHPVWAEISEHFTPKEFEEPEKMDVGFLRLLFRTRVLAGFPFRILDTIRGDPRSAHSELPCAAADLQLLNAWERGRANRAAVTVGFVRCGIYPGTDGYYQTRKKKDGGGFHLDASRAKGAACWTRGIQRDT